MRRHAAEVINFVKGFIVMIAYQHNCYHWSNKSKYHSFFTRQPTPKDKIYIVIIITLLYHNYEVHSHALHAAIPKNLRFNGIIMRMILVK